jgi:hypothetical protein
MQPVARATPAGLGVTPDSRPRAGDPPGPPTPDLPQQHALQLLEAGGRVVEHCEDVLAILRVECGGRPSAYRRFQERLGSVLRTAALQPLRELDDEVVAQGNPGNPHTLRG